MRLPSLAVPLLIALLPLAAMAILQFALPVLAPMLMADVGRPAEAYGWLGGALGCGSVALLLTSHAILPALGPVRTLQAGLIIVLIGIAAVCSGIWFVMLVGAFLIGVGYATTTPAGSQILADFTPRALWGTLFSARMAAVPLGGIIAGALGVAVAPAHGWQVALGLIALACVSAFGVLLAVPRAFNEARPRRAFDARRTFSRDMLARPLRIVLSIPGLPSLGLASWCMACVHAVVTTFYVIYLVSVRGLPLERAAALFSALQISAVIGRLCFGALADRLGSPLPVLKLLAPAAAGSAWLLAEMTGAWSNAGLALATVYIGAVVGAFNGLYLAEVARLAPASDIGDATAAVAAGVFTAYLVMPPLAGFAFIRIGATATLQLVTLFSAVAFILYIWRDRPDRPDVADQR